MAKNYDYGSKSISSWGYVWLNILYLIPVLGWLVWLINALFARNTNIKNHARSYFCGVVLIVILAIIACAVAGIMNILYGVNLFEVVMEYVKGFIKA